MPEESLRGRVVQAIRQAIFSGVLAPGQRLTERELVELTGVSRTSVREALRHLQALGLLETGRGRGLRVASLDRDSVQHIYEVRAALEPTAAELFVKRASDAEVDELLRLPDPLPDDLEQRLEAMYHVDELLVRGARNPILAEILESLHTRIHALRRVSLSIPGRREASEREYDEIFAAIRARDPKRAERASRRHVRAAAEAALQAVELLEPRRP
ncbi:FCD domain-containing protein [Streptomyces sp. NPDC005708]|uniref:GntR family transcriptional regulator n=1 Tax=Streptomyces sp. NPDC005708 TaxID=3154564 RepID=UPI0033C74496